MRLTPWAPGGLSSTRSRCSSRACRTRPSFAPSFAASSGGSRAWGSRRHHRRAWNWPVAVYGLEYVADCVILLDRRVTDQLSTRRLRVVKYRGTRPTAPEYPFLIDERGMSILPITSLGLAHEASTEKVPTGSNRWTKCLQAAGTTGKQRSGLGDSGNGKDEYRRLFCRCRVPKRQALPLLCLRGVPEQLLRNMLSIGLDLAKWTRKGLLMVHSSRPEAQGLRGGTSSGMHKLIRQFRSPGRRRRSHHEPGQGRRPARGELHADPPDRSR